MTQSFWYGPHLQIRAQRLADRARAAWTTPSRVVFKNRNLRLVATPGTPYADTGVVVFTSLRQNVAAGGQLEFAGSASGRGARPCLFISDRRKGWFQRAGVAERVVAEIRAHFHDLGVRRLVVMGDSMGAYAALVFGARLGADVVLAFGPQFGVDFEDSMALDNRWSAARRRIDAFRLGNILWHMTDEPRYYIVHGRQGPDILHWSRFPQESNIRHAIVTRVGHPVSTHLKFLGLLAPTVAAAFDADDAAFAHHIHAAHGRLRRADETWRTHPNQWFSNQSPKIQDAAARALRRFAAPHGPQRIPL